MLTQERLKELLHYDPETGVFTWLVAAGRRVHVGDVAGSCNVKGYRAIKIDSKLHREHRLAWLYVFGEFPPEQLDHINRVRSDNRICNLRLATPSENMQNLSLSRRNNSGHGGVYWHKRIQKFEAYITINKKRIYLGLFSSIDKAIAARKAGESQFHTFQRAHS